QNEAKLDRVARVLHDDVGQVLSAVGLQLDVLRLDLQAESPEIAPRTIEIQKLLESLMVRIRQLSHELNPSVVDRAGLQPALERLVRQLQEDFPGTLRLKFDTALRIPRETARNLFKIAECALSNAVSHSDATRVDLVISAQSGQIVQEIRDNGRGFDPRQARPAGIGMGLPLMECYASGGNISLAIDSAAGKGTIVRASSTASK
ncbi:MAG: sensor histidine kinase, partial [Bryobacteraceae bacterium]